MWRWFGQVDRKNVEAGIKEINNRKSLEGRPRRRPKTRFEDEAGIIKIENWRKTIKKKIKRGTMVERYHEDKAE